jgi:hypothetical protein
LKKRYILALDPSGSYEEGKGTTGWCIWDDDKYLTAAVGEICAVDYDSQISFWKAVLLLLECKALNEKTAVPIEDYLLYAHKADTQINSHMETCQLIGILKYFCAQHHIPYRMQPASEVKLRWEDDVLIRKGIVVVKGRELVTAKTGLSMTRHTMDALRHAVHYATFYNKGEQHGQTRFPPIGAATNSEKV